MQSGHVHSSRGGPALQDAGGKLIIQKSPLIAKPKKAMMTAAIWIASSMSQKFMSTPKQCPR
jgi:hypothetical protein